MSDSDSASYTLRWNEVSQLLEYKSNLAWTSLPSTGVTSLNTLTGGVTLDAGTGISLTPSGNTITIANTSAPATFTPAFFGSFANDTGTTDAGFEADVAITTSFTMTNAAHRVRVTVVQSGIVGPTAGTIGTGSLAMDTVTVGDLCWLSSTTPATTTMQWVFTPGDTAAHTYGAYRRNQSGNAELIVLNNDGTPTMLIEEII
jgi:hypothetical protein